MRYIKMDKLREIIEGLLTGEKIKTLARRIGVSKNTIKTYRKILENIQNNNPLIANDVNSILVLLKDLKKEEQSTNFKWLQQNKDWINSLFTDCNNLVIIHEKLQEAGFKGSYSSFSRYLNKTAELNSPPIVRMETLPGEYAQVDYGYIGKIFDPEVGEKINAYVFVLTLCYSRLAYYEIVKEQNLENWVYCHIHAFEFFGGVPKVIIPDNLKAAIIKASFADPKLNKTYKELARHYCFQIDPCIPGTPEHKGKVESGVKYVKNNFVPLKQFRDFDDANAQLMKWNECKASIRIHGTTKRKPINLFNLYEKKKLTSVNQDRYEISCWKELKVHKDIHVNFNYSYYSVPYEYKGSHVWCRGTKSKIEIFSADQEKIAEHLIVRKGKRQTNFDHYPPDKTQYMQYDTDYCKKQARLIGKNTYQLIKTILDEEPIRNLRGAQYILWLNKKYPDYRIEKACQRAIHFGSYSYGSIKNILEKRLDEQKLIFEIDDQDSTKLDDSYKRNLSNYLKEDSLWKRLRNLKAN
jgi:transposase